MRTLSIVLLLSASLFALSGCGSGGDDDRDASRTSEKDPAAKAEEGSGAAGSDAIISANGSLKFRMTKVGSKDGGGIRVPPGLACTKSLPATCVGEIACPPAKDARAGTAEVCAWLVGQGLSVLTAEPAKDEVCTEQYGGPEVFTVTGEMNGTTVNARFSRTNGCEIARFDSASPLYTGLVGDSGPAERTSSPDSSVSSPDQMQPQEIEDPPSAFE